MVDCFSVSFSSMNTWMSQTNTWNGFNQIMWITLCFLHSNSNTIEWSKRCIYQTHTNTHTQSHEPWAMSQIKRNYFRSTVKCLLNERRLTSYLYWTIVYIRRIHILYIYGDCALYIVYCMLVQFLCSMDEYGDTKIKTCHEPFLFF